MADSGSRHDVFDVDRIRRLVELMKEHDLTEINLRQGEQKIRLRRDEDTFLTPLAPAMAPPIAPAPAAGAPVMAREPAGRPAAQPAKPAATDEAIYITSQMVGTFYASASPEAPAYVNVGDTVGKDTTVCIIEAMKVFNEIPAEVAGKIAEVLVENGDAVEYGQQLFRVTKK